MQANKMLDSVCRQYPVLSPDKQLQLHAAWKSSGDKEYLDQLILSNMRLVISETHKIIMHNPNLFYDDLFQEGLGGLLKAAEKFDKNKEASFATYAIWWIRAYQKRYTMDNRSLVRLGTTRDGRVMFANLSKARAVAESLGLEGYDKVLKISEIIKVPPAAVEQMMVILSGYDSSLDSPIGEDKDTSMIDVLPDNKADGETAVDSAIDDQYSKVISLAIESLPDNEKFIIQHRFMTREPMTFRDLSKKLKMSREWVRKLEARGLERIKRYLAREHNVRE